jgi:hypothetical protein
LLLKRRWSIKLKETGRLSILRISLSSTPINPLMACLSLYLSSSPSSWPRSTNAISYSRYSRRFKEILRGPIRSFTTNRSLTGQSSVKSSIHSVRDFYIKSLHHIQCKRSVQS